MNAVQSKMARAALGWGVRDLAKAAGVSVDTVSRLERGEELMDRTVTAIRAALELAGAVFLDEGSQAEGGAGVRLKTGFTPKAKLASDGPHRGAYRRFVDGAPLNDPNEK